MRFAFSLLALAFCVLAGAQPLRIAVAPIVVTDPCKFAGQDKAGTHDIMSTAALEYLDKAMTATDIVYIDPAKVRMAIEDQKLDFAKGGDRKPEKLQAFGKSLDANYVLVIVADWTEQKNPELSAVASNPNRAKSSSKVRIRVWLHNVVDDRLVMDGTKNEFTGEAKGGYFGTTNPRDMSGDPTSKGIVISSENKKRAQYLGRALVEAIKLALKPQLGLKDPG
jgi:hypothetical protein